MKLHEALSTGLPFRFGGNADWMELCDEDDLFEVSTYLVLWEYWQVRLPDGAITQDYERAMMYIGKFGRHIKASGLDAWALPAGTTAIEYGTNPEASNSIVFDGSTLGSLPPDAYITSHNPGVEFGPHIEFTSDNAGRITEIKRCECGSEAIGGGTHSHWCAKHE